MKSPDEIQREIEACGAARRKERYVPFGGYPDVAKLMILAVMMTLKWLPGDGEAPSTIIARDYSDYYRRKGAR